MTTEPTPKKRGFSWPLAFTVVVIAVLLASVFVFITLLNEAKSATEATLNATREGLSALRQLASSFRSGEVASSFSSFTTQIEGNSRFQFATIDQLELFERTDSQTAFWGQLELPRVVVEARAPVQYSYFLDLEGSWHFVLEDDKLHVQAPPIEFNPPSFNPSKIDYRIQEDSIWRDEQPVLDALRRGMGEMATERASNNIELVRELGRRRTTEFVERWLLANFGADIDSVDIQLVFADETLPAIGPGALRTSTDPAAE